jgi:hypothetical protein
MKTMCEGCQKRQDEIARLLMEVTRLKCTLNLAKFCRHREALWLQRFKRADREHPELKLRRGGDTRFIQDKIKHLAAVICILALASCATSTQKAVTYKPPVRTPRAGVFVETPPTTTNLVVFSTGASASATSTPHLCWVSQPGSVNCTSWTEFASDVTTGEWEVVVYGSDTNRWWHERNNGEFSITNPPSPATLATVCP